MKKILLVNNACFEINKIREQNAMFLNAAKQLKCKLEIKSNIDVYNDLLNEKPLHYDAVLFYDKDIMLAQKLEKLGLKVFNSSKSIEICDNKAKTQICLEKNNIPTPKTFIIPLVFFYNKKYYVKYVDNLVKNLGLPIIAKEWYGSWGEQVYLLKTKNDIYELIEKKQGKELLFQEYIKECTGKDIRINVINKQAVASMKRINYDDFRANLSNGGSMEQYRPTKNELDLAINAAKCVGCDFCGVDILQSNRGPLVCEVNSNAHLINIHKCSGVNVAELILEFVLCKI